ncbi:hypothetical protein TanjilG_24773 [Lupinus angustifolius]|uniref:Gnk2-homologous domain-containing protein n=1 Tax=Lupinus angustifolius TaxID=3871 RepID=A0A4P1RKP4_LUPAN|nr:hypothetical protein TanjilG_24773 [Lupinus angustifolius]
MAIISKLLSFLCFLLIFNFITKSCAQPISVPYCENNSTYTTNSTYHQNLNTLLSNLTSNTETNNYGFYNLSYGQDTNKVYAIGLCRGDIKTDKCNSCLNNARINLTQLCPNDKGAIGWYDDEKCMLRYSDRLIFDHVETGPAYYVWNLNNANDSDQFNKDVINLLNSLKIKAASGDSYLKYAAASANGPRNQIIYGLAQCTPDLTLSECSFCLNESISVIPSCCNNRIGARIVRPSCNLRYETGFPFYEAIAYAPSPAPSTDAPPPAPSTDAPQPPPSADASPARPSTAAPPPPPSTDTPPPLPLPTSQGTCRVTFCLIS